MESSVSKLKWIQKTGVPLPFLYESTGIVTRFTDQRDPKPRSREVFSFLRPESKTFHGNEIVAGTRRLCLMNLFFHNIGEIDGESYVSSADALVAQPSLTVDYVLANPPFGKKSSMTFTNDEGEQEKDDLTYNRQDFWAATSNKQPISSSTSVRCSRRRDAPP